MFCMGSDVEHRIGAILTDHCSYGRHAERLNSFSNSDNGFGEEEDVIFHLMCQRSALARKKWKLLSSQSMTSFIEFSHKKIALTVRLILDLFWTG